MVRDLGRLSETVVELQGKRFAVRTQAQGVVPRIVRCVGASLPNVVRRCDEAAGQLAPERQGTASKATSRSFPIGVEFGQCSATSDFRLS